ncbi:MAG: hypothetical protein E6Q50_07250 [Lysobacter sp.]|nr:MAG: hypothetical protein E6Q50_07250 [Lysobacter sp.]
MADGVDVAESAARVLPYSLRLTALSKIGGELEPNLVLLRVVVVARRRLLVRQKIQQMAQFFMMREDIRVFDLLLRDLPPQEI